MLHMILAPRIRPPKIKHIKALTLIPFMKLSAILSTVLILLFIVNSVVVLKFSSIAILPIASVFVSSINDFATI